MQTLSVELGSRSYPIHIGEGVLGRTQALLGELPHRQVLVVSNPVVADLYLDDLLAGLADRDAHSFLIPDGESHKTLATLEDITTKLLQLGFDRGCALLALGGGVVGDITGFAAASYQRGVDFIQVPTTLLSQVDSSVGGKTAVNHPLGKNMIGAFHQPLAVLADVGTLRSLPRRELSAGLAEVIKYGLIADPGFFSWIETAMTDLMQLETDALVHAVHRSCEIKAKIVAADEREKGQRALLNLGHTFGHAIETGLGYGQWLHGEAVGAGMAMAAYMAKLEGHLAEVEFDRIIEILKRASLPVAAPADITPDRFLALMQRDKKVRDGRIRLVLPRGLGTATVTADYADELLAQTLQEARLDHA